MPNRHSPLPLQEDQPYRHATQPTAMFTSSHLHSQTHTHHHCTPYRHHHSSDPNALLRTMESLLSLSFDYLSSFDAVKIRKGLRQLEGLLAQICLSRSSSPIDRQKSVAITTNRAEEQPVKDLAMLGEDPAFREFFKLQEGFEWNVAIRLIACLERLLGKGSSESRFRLLFKEESESGKINTRQTARTTSSSCRRSISSTESYSSIPRRAPFSRGKST